MPLPRLSALLGGLLLSRRGRSLAARHAGKIALATLAWRLWKNRRAPVHDVPRGARTTSRPPHRRRRWSGRRR
ncbi:cysteine protease [Brevundimonas sp. NPDC055814]